jgi:hypothetical protein
MKSVFFPMIIFVALSSAAQAQQCNYDPSCIAKREGISVAEARNRISTTTACIRSAGYTLNDWKAYRVPAGPASTIRACLSSHGLRS